jgi:hypothetical protein
MRSLAERPDGTNMVSVVVRDKDTEDVTKIKPVRAKVPMNSTCRNTCINKDAAPLRT